VETTPISSAGLLATRLGLSLDSVRTDDSALKSALPYAGPVAGVSSADIQYGEKTYLLLRDSINEFNSLVSLVQIETADLERLSEFLGQIQQVEADLSFAGSAEALDAGMRSLETLEAEMSSFLAERTNYAGDLYLALSKKGTFQQRYFESLNLEGSDLSKFGSDLAVVEVDITNLFKSQHLASTCPICQAAMSAEMGGSDAFLVDEAPAQVNSNVTGATTIGASGLSYVEAIRKGLKWDLSAGETLSYSYYSGAVGYNAAEYGSVTYNAPLGASAISGANQAYLDQAFTAWDKAADFSFEKVTESGTTVGELRSAYTTRTYASAGSAAYAYYPNSGVTGGDIWYIDDQATNLDFSPGGYGYYTALHEIGHALGLSHSFDAGSATGATLPSADDIQRNTVMTYTQYDRNQYWVQSGGSISARYFYATTPGLYDVAAIEYIYGANTSSNTGNTIHQFANWTASAPLYFQTIVDTGGADTFDASAQTRASVINLTPGTFSSVGLFTEAQQEAYWAGVLGGAVDIPSTSISSGSGTGVASRSALYTGADNVGIAFSATIENAIGGSGNDTITGNTANNALQGGAGNDTINGGAGTDTAVFSGAKADYTITGLGTASITVVDNNAADGDDGTDTLTNIEFLEFSDLTVDTSDATGATTASTGAGAIASATAGAAVASSGSSSSSSSSSSSGGGGGGGGGFGGDTSTEIGRRNFVRFQAAMAQKRQLELLAKDPSILANPHSETLVADILISILNRSPSSNWANAVADQLSAQRANIRSALNEIVRRSELLSGDNAQVLLNSGQKASEVARSIYSQPELARKSTVGMGAQEAVALLL